MDKGTFDAITLYPYEINEGERKGKYPKDIYSSKVHSLLNVNGYFLITSCNFTKEELISKFSDGKCKKFYPSFILFLFILFLLLFF